MELLHRTLFLILLNILNVQACEIEISNQSDQTRNQKLIKATAFGQFEKVKKMLQEEDDINAVRGLSSFFAKKINPLSVEVENVPPEIVEYFIAHRDKFGNAIVDNIDQENFQSKTVLSNAISRLIHLNSFNSSKKGWIPRFPARMGDIIKTISLLLGRGADYTKKVTITVPDYADSFLEEYQFKKFKAIVQNRSKITQDVLFENNLPAKFISLVFSFLYEEESKPVECLFEIKGINYLNEIFTVNIRPSSEGLDSVFPDEDKQSLLLLAVKQGQFDRTKEILKERDCKINKRACKINKRAFFIFEGMTTPLIVAADNGHLEIVEYLITYGNKFENGIDIDNENSAENTAFSRAIRHLDHFK